MGSENIFPEFSRFLQRADKERLLGQKGIVIWLYGLSGSGKSTIANAAERLLHQEGKLTTILDGDNLRAGLNSNLSFSDQDRLENIRRISEVAKIFASQGIITFVSAITPRNDLRTLSREILQNDLLEIYIQASYETCEKRDVKGLYAKAARNEIPSFTGKDSGFEIPADPDLILDTETTSIEAATSQLLALIRSRA